MSIIILMTTLFYKALILQGEIWCWSLLGLKGLRRIIKIMSPKDVWIGSKCILSQVLPCILSLLCFYSWQLFSPYFLPFHYLPHRLWVYTCQPLHITCESQAYRLKTSISCNKDNFCYLTHKSRWIIHAPGLIFGILRLPYPQSGQYWILLVRTKIIFNLLLWW